MSNKAYLANFGGWTTTITDIDTVHYTDGQLGLQCALWDDEVGHVPEVLSVNLSDYGLYADAGNVFIKDYSEHEGLTQSLVEANLVKVVRQVTFGPFNTTAYEVEVFA